MAVVVTGDGYIESLVRFVEKQAGQLIEGSLVLKVNPVGLHYAQSRLEALNELDGLLAVDYLRAYVSDLGDHRALEQLRRILRLLTSLKVVSVLPSPARDPTPLSLLPFGRLKLLELRGCDLSTSAARGLLELRHTLEKIICHNSTDALRHIFASRIAEIKDSPQWNRLSFISCACNGLVLMDESLQLLPVVETLDLSRNKFSKLDNIRKCTRLKHLDLGFNNLRTISSFSEFMQVSCRIVKLVLRNNALTTLRGIENLKSLEGLDLSYNVISNFPELEILAGLPSLLNLWLEGNPLCCARWYRAQIFSFFLQPEKLKLDEKKISTREFWKSQIIIASRQKRPASFGFYSPAKGGTELEGSINTKKKKHSRLACIESEEHIMHTTSDQESVSCENETQSKEENVISEEEAEIVGLMNRIELLKKERSARWLQELKDWLNQESENFIDSRSKYDASVLNHDGEQYLKHETRSRHLGESSRYVADSFQASGDESSANFLESDSSFADVSSGLNSHQYLDPITEAASRFSTGHSSGNSVPVVERMDLKQGKKKSFSNEERLPFRAGSYFDPSAVNGGERIDAKISNAPNSTIDDIVGSNTPSICPGSPPHYQEDILHRRHNLLEEFFQLSAESYSVASSDSHTSSSEDDFTKFGPLILEGDQSWIEEFSERSGHEDRHYNKDHEVSQLTQNGVCLFDLYTKQASGVPKLSESDHSQSWRCKVTGIGYDDEIVHCGKQVADWPENRNCKRKPKRRLIPLSEDNNIINGKREPSLNLNGDLDNCTNSMEDEQGRKILCGSIQQSVDTKQTLDIAISSSLSSNGARILSRSPSSLGAEDLVENYFNSNVADLRVHETCKKYTCCNCIIDQNSRYEEIEVAVLLSSEQKLYVLLIDVTSDGSGISLTLIGCHEIDGVREILVGLGLQLLRIYVERGATYLFTARSIGKSRQLLRILHSFDSDVRNQYCSMKSLEQVQVRLFEKHLCGGSKKGIFQYSMLLFSRNNMKEDLWFWRSLFVLEEQLVVCIENFVHFGFLSEENSTSPYYSLDSSCFITDISEMVIDTRESWCVTLSLECATSEFYISEEVNVEEDAAFTQKKPASGSQTWKLKWFSEDSLCNFVALLKAIHMGMAHSSSPLVVRCIS